MNSLSGGRYTSYRRKESTTGLFFYVTSLDKVHEITNNLKEPSVRST